MFEKKKNESSGSPEKGPLFAAKLSGVKREYVLKGETVYALRGVDLEVPIGDYVAIMGASGSGKSTMLNLLGCLDRPTHGKIWLRADDVTSLDDDKLSEIRATRIGFVFQSYNLHRRRRPAGVGVGKLLKQHGSERRRGYDDLSRRFGDKRTVRRSDVGFA